MIKERGALPKFGPCWKSALEHINEGCRYLSEDTQSDIALHITNCFLEMSGHETYNCELDKKQNLRSICINSMSDRAFNVYTEFYTHTQNICWFLRGQIWHETIAENTLKVGEQLEISAMYQQDLIRVQQESIELQEKMLKQGRLLESVLEEVSVSIKAHQDILRLLTQSINSLQTWIVGEVSWIDSIIFNVFALFLIFILTSSERTLPARLPLFFLLFMNMIVERLICSLYTKYSQEFKTQNLYNNLYGFVWYSRYGFTFLGAVILLYVIITYQNIWQRHLNVLETLKKQNDDILKSVEKFRRSRTPAISSTSLDIVTEQGNPCKRYTSDSDSTTHLINCKTRCPNIGYSRLDRESSVDSVDFRSSYAKSKHFELNHDKSKYSLRSHRNGTPDSGVAH